MYATPKAPAQAPAPPPISIASLPCPLEAVMSSDSELQPLVTRNQTAQPPLPWSNQAAAPGSSQESNVKPSQYTAADGSSQHAVVDKTLQTWPEERNFDEWKKILPWTRTLGKGTLYKVIAEAKALQNAFPAPQGFLSSPQSLPADPVQVNIVF
jgi:hypothetical protein